MNGLKLIVLTALFVLMGSAAEAFTGAGTGTVGDPYQITDCDGLREMADDLDAHYRIENHIECGGTTLWNAGRGFAPVGTSTAPFTGSLDGQNFEIRDLYIERADDSMVFNPGDEEYVGLFGYVSNATLENIRLVTASVKGYNYVGGLAGYAIDSTIENIRVNVGINYIEVNFDNEPNTCVPTGCVWARFGQYGGGVVGYAETTTITNVVVGGAVKGSGNIIGGIVGSTLAVTLSDATSTAFVDGGEYIGGIVGLLRQGSMTRVVASGRIDGTNDNGKQGERIGGVVGLIEDNATVTFATSTGEVSGSRDIGGLAGRITESTLSYGIATGQVSGAVTTGGLLGSADDATISTSSAFGNVIGTGSAIGGFAGRFSSGYLWDSFATGDVTGNEAVGGMFGSSGCGAEVIRAYATGDVAADVDVGGFTGNDGCEGPGSTMSQVFATGNVLGSERVGGFLGSSGGMTVTDGYAAGAVTGTNYVGGFSGQVSNSQFINVYARGLVTGDTFVGGLIGESDENTITGSFWDSVASNQSTSPAGSGIATPGMKMSSTFTTAGWDFTTIWGINPTQNNGYPFFRYQGFTHVDTPPAEEPSGGGSSGGGSRPRASRSNSEITTASNGSTSEISAAVRNLILSNRALFERAKALGLTLPTIITQVLGNGGSTTTLPVRDLFRGMSGDDVRALQTLLITHNAGPKAQALARITATGEFVNYTEEALIEYQQKYGIIPATGYFGAITRAQMKAAGLPGLWW